MNEAWTQLRVKATREGGEVERCHGTPHVGAYTVGQHTFGAVSLLLLLHPAPTIELVKMVQWHDVAERWLGDVPSPAKLVGPDFARLYGLAEERLLFQLGLVPLAADCADADLNWVRAVDIIELWLWTGEQLRFGNGNVTRMRVACEEVIARLRVDGRLPEPAAAFYDARRQSGDDRLSDFWPEVEELMRGPGEAAG